MVKMYNVLIIGAGARAEKYMGRILEERLPIRASAVAEPIKERRELFSKKNNIPLENRFETGEQALSRRGKYDAVFITTPDKTHHKLAIQALEGGYNVLLEKPMATTAKECVDIVKAQQKSQKTLAVCHVLRYAPFFQEIKKITQEGELGKVLRINLVENVAYWHFAHSYVRGNWAKEKEACPIILAKSSHDLDLLTWIADSEAEHVFSTGGREYFTKENEHKDQEGNPQECTSDNCVYNAERFYLGHGDNPSWPFSSISLEDPTEEGRKKVLETTQYGKCVFKCDNDVCDTQDVLIKFKNKIRANFTLTPSGPQPTRRIQIDYEKGQVIGDLFEGKMTKTIYTGRRGEDIKRTIEFEAKEGHGGGDIALMKGFIKQLDENNPETNITSAQRSLEGHLIAFAAEQSRKLGEFGASIKMDDFKSNITSQ